MSIAFNGDLAAGLQAFNSELREKSAEGMFSFVSNPTDTVKSYLTDNKVTIPDPKTFHVHIIRVGEELPKEPERATIDRYIYVFRESGLFEFKVVPGSPEGNDDMMEHPTGACCCCNCCVIELPLEM